MTSCVLTQAHTINKQQNTPQKHMSQYRGCGKQQSSMRKPGIPHFFSVQRLRGFRQVVQHVQEHVAVGINCLIKSRKGRCCSGRKSKLVEDRYMVLCTVTLIQETKQNTKNQKKQKPNKKQ